VSPLFEWPYFNVNSKEPFLRIGGKNSDIKSLDDARKPFLTYYRSAMMILTCINILAVDFPVYPLEFAKTENFGISLMDIGVGSCVFSMSLVSVKVPYDKNVKKKFFSRIVLALKAVFPILALGMVRTLVVKFSNYQEHVTEYGVYWNFFITLAFIGLFTSVVDIDVKYLEWAGAILILIYQIILYLGVEEYIITEHPRTNFLSQNKEGIFSLIGYTSLFYLGAKIGYYIREKTRSWKHKVYVLAIITLLTWFLAYFLENFLHLPPSRRMANLTYVLYVLSINLLVLILCLMIDIFSNIGQVGVIFQSISYQRNSQLIVFLIANVLTGIINKSIFTLAASNTLSLVILSGYTFAIVYISFLFMGNTL